MRRLAILAALAAILAGACQTGPTTPPPKPPDALSKADDKLFRGDYDGAEKDFLAQIDAKTPRAHSHYALLLDYTNRFQGAVAEARAGMAEHPDSFSLARLTRALDWSESVAEAVIIGAKAVKTEPVDPLAHIFYAEALADSGQYPHARDELKAGEKAARDAYARAEVDREWANYYRAKSDPLEELNRLQLSLREQPEFPERALELARYQNAKGRTDAAAKSIKDLAKKYSGQYAVLTELADASFLQSQPNSAISSYQAALKVRPDGPAATLGLAEVDVAVSRDFTTAHDRLLASLTANPKEGAVYQYLKYLDLLVLKKDPAADLAFASPPPEDALAASRKQAYDAVNAVRAGVGLPAVKEDPALAESALAHSYFFLFNFGQQQEAGIGIHFQDPSLPGYFGKNSSDRAVHFGYRATNITSEDISHAYHPAAAVQRWTDTVYHRLPITTREATLAGYGEAQVGALSMQVLDFGIGPRVAGELVVYPADSANSVPAAFLGGEVPDPLPNTTYPVGYPITLQAPWGSVLKIAQAGLSGPDGKDVQGFTIAPGANNLGPHEFSMLGAAPLVSGRYTATVTGSVDGAAFTKTWSFTVQAP